MAVRSRSSASRSGVIDASKRVVILHGAEQYLLSAYTKQLVDVLTEAHGEIGRFAFEGESATAAQVLDELRSFGLMQPHKLVIVDAAEKFLARGDHRRLLEAYCERPMEESTLLMRAAAWRAGNLDKLVAKIGVILDCKPPDAARATEWALARSRKASGQEIAPEAAALLVERIGPDLARLDTELAKLAAFAGRDAPITIEHVRELTAPTREELFWKVQAPLMEGDAAATLLAIDELYAKMPPAKLDVPLTFAMVDAVRKLHDGAALLRAGASAWEAARAMKLWGSDRDRMVEAMGRAARLPAAVLARLLHQAVRTEQRTRNGEATSTRRALEGLAAQVAGVVGGAPRRRQAG